jgi:hypothetical protein
MADKAVIILPGIVMLLYAGTAIAWAYKREPAWALTWAAYAIANIGLIWASLK